MREGLVRPGVSLSASAASLPPSSVAKARRRRFWALEGRLGDGASFPISGNPGESRPTRKGTGRSGTTPTMTGHSLREFPIRTSTAGTSLYSPLISLRVSRTAMCCLTVQNTGGAEAPLLCVIPERSLSFQHHRVSGMRRDFNLFWRAHSTPDTLERLKIPFRKIPETVVTKALVKFFTTFGLPNVVQSDQGTK